LLDHAAVKVLHKVFDFDWENSTHYEAPDPLVALAHEEHDFPHDPELEHE